MYNKMQPLTWFAKHWCSWFMNEIRASGSRSGQVFWWRTCNVFETSRVSFVQVNEQKGVAVCGPPHSYQDQVRPSNSDSDLLISIVVTVAEWNNVSCPAQVSQLSVDNKSRLVFARANTAWVNVWNSTNGSAKETLNEINKKFHFFIICNCSSSAGLQGQSAHWMGHQFITWLTLGLFFFSYHIWFFDFNHLF